MYSDVVLDELKRSFLNTPERRTQFAIGKVNKVVMPEVVKAMDAGYPNLFQHVWIEVFTHFPDQEALRCTIRIFDRVGLPVPKRLRPVVNTE